MDCRTGSKCGSFIPSRLVGTYSLRRLVPHRTESVAAAENGSYRSSGSAVGAS